MKCSSGSAVCSLFGIPRLTSDRLKLSVAEFGDSDVWLGSIRFFVGCSSFFWKRYVAELH